jgi:subtilisin family serine protease
MMMPDDVWSLDIFPPDHRFLFCYIYMMYHRLLRLRAVVGATVKPASSVGVAVIDTGVSMHRSLNDVRQVWSAYGTLDDDNGHGTYVAGIIAAAAGIIAAKKKREQAGRNAKITPVDECARARGIKGGG